MYVSVTTSETTVDFSNQLNMLKENNLYDGTVWAYVCKGFSVFYLTVYDDELVCTNTNSSAKNPKIKNSRKIKKEEIEFAKFNWLRSKVIIKLKNGEKLKYAITNFDKMVLKVESVFNKLGIAMGKKKNG